MQAKQPENSNRLVLSEKNFQKIADLLNEFLRRSRATLCVFADMNGYPIAHQGSDENVHIANLTALAAGDFLATSEIARITQGDNKFKFIYHEGTTRNLYLCNVSDDYLMIVLFEKSVALGMIRVLTGQFIEGIQALLKDLQQKEIESRQFIDHEFRALLGRELDKVFGQKDH